MRLAGLSIIALSGLLAACVMEEGPRPQPPQAGGPQACTFQYDPVCGERDGRRETYGNACMARVAGARIVHGGECRRGGGSPTPPPTRACTREYKPVCGVRRGDKRTFGNACEAEAAEYRILHKGEC